MDFKEIKSEALRIKSLYSKFEIKNFSKKWKKKDVFVGLVSDIGDLSRLVLADDGLMKIDNINKRIGHELSDCLWDIIVLADEYGIDIEKEFIKNMKDLEKKIDK
jgi:NTP pyrophosphatase (non-canonical NTP hydrolase)